MTAPLTASSRPVPVASTGPLSAELVAVTGQWAESQHRIIALAAEFADSAEWVLAGSPSPAHWLAAVAGIEASTAREWVRIGRRLRELPAIADAFDRGALSYSKVLTLTRIATTDNETDLVAIALDTAAGDLGRALAAWLTRTSSGDDLDRHHQRQRSVRWRTEPDGIVTFTLRLPPLAAAMLIAWLTKWVMTSRRPVSRHRDDAEGRPINASGRQRHPTTRQKRIVKERDQVCRACGRNELLHHDHVPDYEISRHTVIDELQLRCAPCHQRRHAARGARWCNP